MRIDLSKDRYALEKIMEMDHVIQVHEDGTVTDDIAAIWAPEVYDNTVEDGVEDLTVSGEGWTLERGWTGQWGYNGPVMHDSEFVGGDLAEHILSTPGYWVVVEVDGGCDCTDVDDDDDIDDYELCGRDHASGWAVAFREV